MDSFVGGLYSLNGKRYSEDIQYHVNKSAVGQKVNMSMEMKGDTLIQIWPADDMGNVDKNKSNCEKYVRIK